MFQTSTHWSHVCCPELRLHYKATLWSDPGLQFSRGMVSGLPWTFWSTPGKAPLLGLLSVVVLKRKEVCKVIIWIIRWIHKHFIYRKHVYRGSSNTVWMMIMIIPEYMEKYWQFKAGQKQLLVLHFWLRDYHTHTHKQNRDFHFLFLPVHESIWARSTALSSWQV